MKKVYWVVAFCATMMAFLYNVSAISLIFADFPVTVSITLLHETELIFPAVTVCNMSPVRQSSLGTSSTFQEAAEAKRRKRRSAGTCRLCLQRPTNKQDKTDQFLSKHNGIMLPLCNIAAHHVVVISWQHFADVFNSVAFVTFRQLKEV